MLNIKKENLEKSKVKLTIDLPPELMRGYFTKIYNKLATTVEVKGFRPGKAPRNLTIMQIGENRLTTELIDLALQETYPQALKQENLIPIAPPKINIKKMVDLTGETAEIEYEAEIELLPEVKIGNYKKIKLEPLKKDIKASEDEIDQVISHLRRQHATFEDKSGPAKDGDRIEMDFEGTERGVVLENLTSKNYPVILGSKVLLPEFEKEIIGLKKDDEKKFKLKIGKKPLPEKLVDFKVKIHLVQDVIMPALNDELAKKFNKNTIKELTDAVAQDIVKQKEIAQKQNKENKLVDELIKISDLIVPESLADQETSRMVNQLKERTSMAGIPFDKYLEGVKKTEDELKKDLQPQAERTVKIGLILGEIGKLEKIDLNKEDGGKKVIERLIELNEK